LGIRWKWRSVPPIHICGSLGRDSKHRREAPPSKSCQELGVQGAAGTQGPGRWLSRNRHAPRMVFGALKPQTNQTERPPIPSLGRITGLSLAAPIDRPKLGKSMDCMYPNETLLRIPGTARRNRRRLRPDQLADSPARPCWAGQSDAILPTSGSFGRKRGTIPGICRRRRGAPDASIASVDVSGRERHPAPLIQLRSSCSCEA
jgi:hypothetical protein